MMFQHKSINDGLLKAIKNTVAPSEQVDEDMGLTAGLAAVGTLGASYAAGHLIGPAAMYLKDKWNEHKTNRMFEKTSGKLGNIAGKQQPDGRYHVKWHDGTESAHHAGNDEAEWEEPQISPTHWHGHED
jgi:hypothetical protein